MRKPPLHGSWDGLATLLQVARAGGMAPAARALGVDEATVKRRLDALERKIGLPLLETVSGRKRLTDIGKHLVAQAEAMDGVARRLALSLEGYTREAQNLVRISASEGLAAAWIAPRLIGLMRRHPGLQIELVSTQSVSDLGAGEADIALRYGDPGLDPDTIVHARGQIHFALLAARSYLDVYGEPCDLDDLRLHRIILRIDDGSLNRVPAWAAIASQAPTLRLTGLHVYTAAMRAGAGIGLGPHWYPRIDPMLVALPIRLGAPLPLYLLSHNRVRGNPAVRSVVRHLKAQFEVDRVEWFS